MSKSVEPHFYTLKKPYIYKTLDVSSAHISENDDRRLKAEDCPISAYMYGPEGDEYGHLVAVGDKENFEASMKACEEEGFSESFLKICRTAHEQGCEYVRIDRDGAEYDDLQTFTW